MVCHKWAPPLGGHLRAATTVSLPVMCWEALSLELAPTLDCPW